MGAEAHSAEAPEAGASGTDVTGGRGDGSVPADTAAADGRVSVPSAAAGTREADGSAEPAEADGAAEPVAERRSRRFPLFTRTTARPEGGGRAASGDAPAPARQWPLLSVMAAVGAGLLVVAFGVPRIGTTVIALALIGGAVLRWMLPSVGMLAVRSRFTDIATYGVLGAAILMLSMMVQPSPWLEIPWLQDVVRFTVR